MKKILAVISTVAIPILTALLIDKLIQVDAVGLLFRFLVALVHFFSNGILVPFWFLGILVLVPISWWYLQQRLIIQRIPLKDLFTKNKTKEPKRPDFDTIIKGNELSDEARLYLLGYQNDGAILAYKMGLLSESYEAGFFTVAEIGPDAEFLREKTTFDNWLEEILSQELSYFVDNFPKLFKKKSVSEVKNQVFRILSLRTSLGRILPQEVFFQEYSDILHRIILMATVNNADYGLDLYPTLTSKSKKRILDFIHWLEENKRPSTRDWLYLSIAAGLLGADQKFVPNGKAFNSIRNYVISLDAYSIKETGERLWNMANTKTRVDAGNVFFHSLRNSSWRPFRIVTFTGDYIETIFLLKFYDHLLDDFSHVEVDLIPRSTRCGNDATWEDINELLVNFRHLHKNHRFHLYTNGPKLSSVNLLKLDHVVMDLIASADIVDARGARNYEVMQGINREIYFSFMVGSEFSEATTGLHIEDTPLIFVRQPAGERSFNGFRQRHRRRSNGRMLCTITLIDDKERWEGGHIATYQSWSDEKRERFDSLLKFYSRGAIPFHNKYGDHLELDVQHALEMMKGRVLVLGCGSGKEVSYLVNHGCDVYGIDASDEAIQIARNLYPSIWDHFFVEDIYNLALIQQGDYDGIVSNAVYVHLLERSDITRMLEVMKKRLKHGGLGYIRLIHKADSPKEEFDHHLFQMKRWFVYYTLEELEFICNSLDLKILSQEKHQHVLFPLVTWISITFQK